MIWIMGDEAEAEDVAKAAGLQPEQWTRLHWYQQLAGEQNPHVVALDSSMHWEREKFGAIVSELVARSAVRWNEIDLYVGKVPR